MQCQAKFDIAMLSLEDLKVLGCLFKGIHSLLKPTSFYAMASGATEKLRIAGAFENLFVYMVAKGRGEG